MPKTTTPTYLDYSVGDVFAVPLASRGFGLGLVVAMEPGKRKSVGRVWLFGFGPRRRTPPTQRTANKLRLADALAYAFQGDRALTTGRWKRIAHIDALADSQLLAPPCQCSNGRQVLWHNLALDATDFYDAFCLPKRLFTLLPAEHGFGDSSCLEYELDNALKQTLWYGPLNTTSRARAAWRRAIALLSTEFARPRPKRRSNRKPRARKA